MHVQWAPLIHAASFKFLGSVYTAEGSSAADLPARLGAARASWALWKPLLRDRRLPLNWRTRQLR
eukprot:1277406-Amphidinium_carterae.1